MSYLDLVMSTALYSTKFLVRQHVTLFSIDVLIPRLENLPSFSLNATASAGKLSCFSPSFPTFLLPGCTPL